MKKTWVILFGILLIGAFLRFYNLGKNSFVADEFLDINSSYAYLKTGQWQSWDFNQGKVNQENEFAPRDERAWLYKIQVAKYLDFVAPTEANARTISVLWGLISIVLMYLIGKNFTKNNKIGLLSAFLFAISISGIIFDRRLRMYAMFFPIFLLFSWLFYKTFEHPYKGKHILCKPLWEKLGINGMYIIPTMLAGFVSLHLHMLTINIVAIFAVYVFVQMLIKIKNKEKLTNKYSIIFALILLGSIFAYVLFPQKAQYALGTLKFFNDNYSYFSMIFNDYSHVALAIIAIAAGFYYLWKNKTENQSLWLLLSFFVPSLMAVFLWRRNAGAQYIFFAQSFEIILAAAGIYAIAKFFSENISKFSKQKVFVSSIVLSLLVLPNYAYFFQENNAYHQTSKAENPNYKSIFAYIKKKRNSQDVIITRNFRNYYLSGAQMKVYDFGGELSKEKMSLKQVQDIVEQNKSGWVMLSENDERYISNEALDYMEKNMTKINDIAVRGNAVVYGWGNN